jgi:hypothetical protein
MKMKAVCFQNTVSAFCVFIVKASQNVTVEKASRKYDGNKWSLIDEGEFCGICEIVKIILSHCYCTGDS